MQSQFLTFAFGGSNKWSGRSMEAAHKKLVSEKGLNGSHFDVIVELLGETLTSAGISADLIQQVVVICESVRDPVLGLTAKSIANEN